MKKVWQIVSIVVVIALALGMTAFAESEKKPEFSVDSIKVELGEEKSLVEVPVKFEGNAKVTSLQVEVGFSSEISFVEYKPGNVLEGIVEPAAGTNPVVMPFVDETLSGAELKDGTFATLVVEVPTNEVKNFTVIVKVVVAADVEFNECKDSFNCVNGLISVGSETLDNENVFDEEREATREERKQDVIALKINAGTAYAFGKTAAIDPDNSKVVPYLKNDRTLVPLRFVSETLGADVQWEEGWDYCYVVKGDKKIKITFNSADIEVNGQVVTYDAPVEVVQNRTMVPIRFISEELGYDVTWNQANQLVIITPVDNPWVADRQAEVDALEGILVTFLFNGIF